MFRFKTFFRIRLYLIVWILVLSSRAYSQTDKPNIIFILTDDQRWDALGYAGNSIIQTPEMDKLDPILRMPFPVPPFVLQAGRLSSPDFTKELMDIPSKNPNFRKFMPILVILNY